MPRRVLPLPPGPVSVSRQPRPSRRRACASSSSLPMKLVSGLGRLSEPPARTPLGGGPRTACPVEASDIGDQPRGAHRAQDPVLLGPARTAYSAAPERGWDSGQVSPQIATNTMVTLAPGQSSRPAHAAVDGHRGLQLRLRASLIAAQTRSGVVGMSMWRTPSWLTVAGVSLVSSSKLGSSVAVIAA